MNDVVKSIVDFLSKGDFLLILLFVLIFVIVVFIIYLIKLEISGKYEKEEIYNDSVTDSINEIVSEEKPIMIESEQVEENSDVEDTNEYNNEDLIMDYEQNQEESAIISAEELDERLMKMNEEDISLHEKEIERYENEQEDKAIISYDELIKRAGIGVINYETEKDLGGIRVSKVDFNNAKEVKFDKSPYYEEENFLESLKEFRRNL